jgi:pyruvate kinase
MKSFKKRTKIVATIGPASNSPEILKQMIEAGMNVARLNFSHGNYQDHAQTIARLRSVSQELDTPITLLQDLQGPKIRVGQFPNGSIELMPNALLTLLPIAEFSGQPNTIAIDYPHLAADAQPETKILLDDGLMELVVESVQDNAITCRVLEGGILKSRKGVNIPSLNLRLPSMTEKDQEDLEFGLSQGIDWVSLSFVRQAADIRALKEFMAAKGATDLPVMAKIEKPQAIANLDEIIAECDGLMVARGDLGVEMSPEKVPLLQKEIIRKCNRQNIPVITATQMLESMISNSRPTRAEASDVANAIIDGTDAVMLSGESAVGNYPVKAVKMLANIAADIESQIEFVNNPPAKSDETHALSEALNAIDKILDLRCIVAFTSSGYTALIASGERPKAPVVALTPHIEVYHRLNLIWGVKPIHIDNEVTTFEDLAQQAETQLIKRDLAQPGDKILIMGGIPTQQSGGTNFLKIHSF